HAHQPAAPAAATASASTAVFVPDDAMAAVIPSIRVRRQLSGLRAGRRRRQTSRARRGGALKAVVIREFGPPEVMRLEEVPTPEPGPGEVVVRVHAVSVNRTLDLI